jgi:hypothetical protein
LSKQSANVELLAIARRLAIFRDGSRNSADARAVRPARAIQPWT